MNRSSGVRPLTLADLEWVLDLSGRRRAGLRRFAPRFWSPASDARAVHRSYLGQQISDPAVFAIRTDHGFLFAPRLGDQLDVDDLAVDDTASDQDAVWRVDGEAMLRSVLAEAKAHGGIGVRFVCPVPEPRRAQLAAGLDMTLTESWWHRDLEGAPRDDAARDAADPDNVDQDGVDDSSLSVDGAVGALVTAPPVYRPGGPVVLVRRC